MATHLFTNFLEDTAVYQQNIDFWKKIIYPLLSVEKIEFKEYLSTTKKDGSLYTDGNPIFNMKVIHSNRALRIIQEEIEMETVEFSAWLDTIEIENEQIDELVISLELSHESTLLAINLINAWLIGNFSKHKMEKHINTLLSLKKSIFITDFSSSKVA